MLRRAEAACGELTTPLPKRQPHALGRPPAGTPPLSMSLFCLRRTAKRAAGAAASSESTLAQRRARGVRAGRAQPCVQIGVRLPNSDHESGPWRIAEIAPDFRREDVWALPARGGAEDFGALLEVMASLDPAKGESVATRVLFSIRFRLGGWFGWDDAARELAIPANAETLSARLPVDMALIRPFRHRVVYPALMRQIERAWNARLAQRPE